MKINLLLLLTFSTLISVCASKMDDKSLQEANQVEIIIIDAAHGGRDFGVVTNYMINDELITFNEKDVTLNIALLLKEKLSEAFPNTLVILTREHDIPTSRNQRFAQVTDGLSQVNGENMLVISIHANFSFDRNKRGTEIVFTRSEDNLLTEIIRKEFEHVLGDTLPISRQLEENFLFGHRNTQVPYIMVETGFLSNREEAQILFSDEGLENCSNALLRSISAYMSLSSQ